MKIEFTQNPTASDIDHLTQKINEEKTGFGSAYIFGFFVRDDGKIIAGCNGSVIYGFIYTDQLWVDASHRGRGIGVKLMAATHEYGRSQSCSTAIINTMSFQGAVDFYKKLGKLLCCEN